MIVCSIILAWKPLHICRGTAIVCLCIWWCPRQIYWILQRFWTSLSLFQTLFPRMSPRPVPVLASGMSSSSPLFTSKSFKVILEGFGGLQHPMASHPKSHFIRFLLAQSNPLSYMRTYISCCSGLCLPLQPNSQGSEYVMDNSSFSFPTGRSPWGPPQEIYNMVDISHFLSGCLVPTSSLADWSAPGSSLGMLPRWPQQHMCSASFHPHPAAWRNISCSTTDWWGVPRPHLGYSSRKSSESTILSDSQKDIPFSSACSWATRALSFCPP